jgi:hypothetical protein
VGEHFGVPLYGRQTTAVSPRRRQFELVDAFEEDDEAFEEEEEAFDDEEEEEKEEEKEEEEEEALDEEAGCHPVSAVFDALGSPHPPCEALVGRRPSYGDPSPNPTDQPLL